MSEKLLSIIIPCFNSADTLPVLLQSIPDDSRIEVIVVDDHSDKLLEEYQSCQDRFSGRNIAFYRNLDGKKGAGSARNVGLSSATGRYVLFADADDFFYQDGFMHLLDEIDSYDKDIYYYYPDSVDADGNPGTRHTEYKRLLEEYYQNKDRKSEVFVRCRFHVPWSKVIRRNLIVEHRILFDEVRFSNDVMFSAKCGLSARSIEVVPQKLYCCTHRAGSLVTNKDPKSMRIREKVSIRHYFYCRKHLSKEEARYFGWSLRSDYRMLKHWGSQLVNKV